MRAIGLHPERQIEVARAAFIESGYDAGQRQRDIDGLESKTWKDRTVYRVLCRGRRGKGPHWVWLGESLLWCLISLDAYVCPYHAGDDPILGDPVGIN
jgi:hypothetical protein